MKAMLMSGISPGARGVTAAVSAAAVAASYQIGRRKAKSRPVTSRDGLQRPHAAAYGQKP